MRGQAGGDERYARGALCRRFGGGYFDLSNGIIPANVDATLGWLETWAAETSLDATLRREGQATNPVPITDENLMAAIKLRVQRCAI